MLGKADLLDTLARETAITKHLLGKVPAGGLDYRPTPGQRSTLELLRYLSHCGIGGTLAMADGNWDGYKSWAARCAKLTAPEIPAALDRQSEALAEFFAGVTDEALATREATTPLGEKLPLGRALLELPVKWMTAYRMQLFLYLKAAGNDGIWTPNCWGGVDVPRPQPSGA